MVKPDGVARGLIGKIITKFEDKGLKLVAMKFMKVCVCNNNLINNVLTVSVRYSNELNLRFSSLFIVFDSF